VFPAQWHMSEIRSEREQGGDAWVPALAREIGFGFLYWLAFLLVLEPDNILRMVQAGGGPGWDEEIARIAVASLLGGLASPLLLALVRNYPIEGTATWRHAAIEAAAGALISSALIFISCVLADWFMPSEHRPFLVALREELISNWAPVLFSVAGFLAIAHASRFVREIQSLKLVAPPVIPAPAYLSNISIKERGRISIVQFSNVDWIETQGNYLALHVGPTVHLLRESLARLEPQLDPTKFARIHRRLIVAKDRIREVTSAGAGDALLRLADGTELRLSRLYRDRLDALIA
jgi:two-component system LytT family response regulator